MKKILAILGLIGVGIAGRLIPHAPNATPITAVTIAARKYVGRTWAFVIPLAAMVISDAVIGFYNWKIMLSVYSSFVFIACASKFAKRYGNPASLMLLAVVSSLIFFLVTNFTVWIFSPWYAKSISGLLYCYELGIPFLRNMLVGDVAYTALLVGAFELAQMRVPMLRTATKAASVF